MFDVITLGSATMDVLIESSIFADSGHGDLCFPLGSKIAVEKMYITTGGGGTNSAVTFARQGMKVACVGIVGNDPNGRDLLEELQKEGVDTSFFQHHSDDLTAYSVILVHPSGERTILSYKGEGQHFTLEKLEIQRLKARWIFINSIGGHFDLLEKLINHASKNNIKVACNLGIGEIELGLEKLKLLLGRIDIFIANKEETERLFGQGNPRDYINGIIAVTDGENGVRVTDKDGNIHTAEVPNSPVVDTTGAGDAFGSGFVCEYMRSSDMTKAIQFGLANAASVIAHFGAKEGILKI